MNKEYQSTGNHELVRLAQSMGFHIHGLAIIKGREMVCKKTDKGEYFWWPIENEGSGFLKLFKGFSSAETTSKVYEDEIQVRHDSEMDLVIFNQKLPLSSKLDAERSQREDLKKCTICECKYPKEQVPNRVCDNCSEDSTYADTV